ncbi:MAG TPA: protein kinase [Polyangia bacterium]|nr:protein kinase [Polyangia bacterium]
MLRTALAHARPVQIGPYLLSECIGQGGMAVVYRATRQGPAGFEKTLVVKCMLPALTTRRDLVELFYAEAKLSAQLSHPNIVQVHDFGVQDDVPFIVMEYLNGHNLTQLRNVLKANGKRLPVGAALAIAREMAHALAYAHEFVDGAGVRRQVIHRDVSPSNVMVCRDGSVKLLDFGVAKVSGAFDYERTQSFRGKYAYMAPEQVNREPIDRRIDVFAAGIVLHELLAGKRLFAAPSDLETLERVSAAQVVAPSVDNPEVPRSVDAVVKKALARDPEQRFASGAELAAALDELDGVAFSRVRLKACLAQLVPVETVTCDVCGKAVVRGDECSECSTVAPLFASIEADEPAPLPPPPDPEPDAPRLPPRLSVVRTPLPESPYTEPVDFTPLETQVDPESPWMQPMHPQSSEPTPVEPASLPPPAAPKLFVVPQQEPVPAPWEESRPWEVAGEPPPRDDDDLERVTEERKTEPRPKVSSASFDFASCDPPAPAMGAPRIFLPTPVEPSPLVFDLRPRATAWGRAIAVGVVAGLLALAIAVVVRRAPSPQHAAPAVATAPIVTPLAPINPQLASVKPQLESVKPKLDSVKPKLESVKPKLESVKPQLESVKPQLESVKPQLVPAASSVRPHRARVHAAETSGHGVKEGRLVDPFAGLD